MANTTNNLVKNWEYQYDKNTYKMSDVWKVLKPSDDGKYRGDCEDFALTWAFLECGESYSKLYLSILKGTYRIWYIEGKRGGGHAVLELPDGTFVDNWSRRPVTREFMEKNYGHKFIRAFLAVNVFIRLALGS
jgi:predicted transglutaminase-like cysteine proteinase